MRPTRFVAGLTSACPVKLSGKRRHAGLTSGPSLGDSPARQVAWPSDEPPLTRLEPLPGDVSPYGVHDMGGNVSEWVEDWSLDVDYYRQSQTRNPKDPDSGRTQVVRGGLFSSSFPANIYEIYQSSQ